MGRQGKLGRVLGDLCSSSNRTQNLSVINLPTASRLLNKKKLMAASYIFLVQMLGLWSEGFKGIRIDAYIMSSRIGIVL